MNAKCIKTQEFIDWIRGILSLNTIENVYITSQRGDGTRDLPGCQSIKSFEISINNKKYYIDVRYAFGVEIFKQNLIDHGYSDCVISKKGTNLNLKKVIVYICSSKVLQKNKLIKRNVNRRYILGNIWNEVIHVYINENIVNFFEKDKLRINMENKGYSTRGYYYMHNYNNKNNRIEGGLRTKGIMKRPLENRELISIVTPVLNGEKFIDQTIQSVINQDYKNLEYIIVDGGSEDGTLDIIKQYENEIDYWLTEKDKGIYYAMDKGIKLSKGKYIGNINAGDLYCSNIVSDVIYSFNKLHELDFIHGDMFVVNKNIIKRSFGKQNKKSFNKGMSINHPTVFIRRKTYFEIGGYNFKYKIGSDADLMLKLITKSYFGFKIDRPLAYFRKGGISSLNIDRKFIESILIRRKYKLSIFNVFTKYFKEKIKKLIKLKLCIDL